MVPPAIGIGVADYFSQKSRAKTGGKEEVWKGEENEWLITYCKEMLAAGKNYDFFVFGHRHLPIDFRLNNVNRYINLGDWIHYCSYAEFDGADVTLKSYTGQEHKIIRNW